MANAEKLKWLQNANYITCSSLHFLKGQGSISEDSAFQALKTLLNNSNVGLPPNLGPPLKPHLNESQFRSYLRVSVHQVRFGQVSLRVWS